MRVWVALAAASIALASPPAQAQTEEARPAELTPFGPVISIERIDVVGNSITAERLIRRALPFAAGDSIRAGDARLREARYKVLALGYFRDVSLSMRKGSRRGRVVLTVEVVERGTVVLERMYFGTTLATPWWAGLDATERNVLGTGLGVGGAFVFAGEGRAAGADSQRAFQLRVTDPALLGTPLGVYGLLQYVDASEPYRVSGDAGDASADHFAAFAHRRLGGKLGASWNLTALSTLTVGGRLELVDAELPSAPTRTFPDGRVEAIDLHLEPGDSRVVTASLGFDRDTRPDPVLPYAGERWQLFAELGGPLLASDYTYGTVLAKYERWWSLGSPQHVISMHLTGGAILGDAPRFDRLHVGDLNRMVAPRALGLVVSTTPSLDLLGRSSDEAIYGELGGVAEAQYAFRLFRSSRHVYGGDLFVGAGLWSLARRDDVRALPLDLLLDVGLRLDTEIGIFELSLANGLGRIPL